MTMWYKHESKQFEYPFIKGNHSVPAFFSPFNNPIPGAIIILITIGPESIFILLVCCYGDSDTRRLFGRLNFCLVSRHLFYWWHFAPDRHPGSHARCPFSHQIRRDVVKRWTPSAASHCWQIRTMVGVWLESIRITNWGRNPTLSANSGIKFRLEVEEAFKKQNNPQRIIASYFLFSFKDFNVICDCFQTDVMMHGIILFAEGKKWLINMKKNNDKCTIRQKWHRIHS